MIPLLAALSNCESTCDVTAGSLADLPFLKRVFRRVFASRFRSVRFSLWRTHLTAALMLGTKGRVPDFALRDKRMGLQRRPGDHLLVGSIAAGGDPALVDRLPDRAVRL